MGKLTTEKCLTCDDPSVDLKVNFMRARVKFEGGGGVVKMVSFFELNGFVSSAA